MFDVGYQRDELVQAHADHSDVRPLARAGATLDALGIANEDR